MKNLFLFTFCGLLCLSCSKEPIIESGTTGELTWKLSESGTLIISGKGAMPDYEHLGIYLEKTTAPWNEYKDEITNVIIGNGINNIGNSAFGELSKLRSITIGNSVTIIGNRAFRNCNNLTSVSIPNPVASIGNHAFAYCSGLTSVSIPNSVTYIGYYAFAYCSGLTSVTIPNSVTYIGSYVFGSCSSLTFITIPNSLTHIGDGAFMNCSGLTSINVDNSNTAYSSEDGTLFNKPKTTLIQYPEGKAGAYTIPNSATSIGDNAFFRSGLTLVNIPNSVTSIGRYAFYGSTDLTSATIGNSVTSIGMSAFDNCTGLIEIINKSDIPQDIYENNHVFYRVNLSACTLRVPVASIDAYRAAPVWKDFGNIVAIQ